MSVRGAARSRPSWWVALLARAALLLAVTSLVLFVAVRLLPGDPVSQALGVNGTAARAAALRAQLGLDAPAPLQYLRWVAGLLHGDLGVSAVTRAPIEPIVAARAGHSAALALVSLVAIAVVGVGGGLVAGSRPGSHLDRSISVTTVMLTAAPEFATGAVLVAVLAIGLGWLPAVSLLPPGTGPWDEPQVLVLPAAALTLYGGAYAARMVRTVVADVAASPSVEAARIAGLPERAVLLRHVLPVVASPVAQVLALLVPYLVGGAVVVETVFAYPGLGALLASSVRQGDAIAVCSCGMVLATVAVGAFVLAELVHRRAPAARDGAAT